MVSNNREGSKGTIPLPGPGDVLSLMTRQIVRGLVNHFYDKPPRSYKTPRGKLNEGAMSTQPWPVTPALSTNFESYVDCKRAAEFLSVDRKTIQISREGRIPAHPVLSSPRPIAFQACEPRIHEIPGQGFRELKERSADRDPPHGYRLGFVRQESSLARELTKRS